MTDDPAALARELRERATQMRSFAQDLADKFDEEQVTSTAYDLERAATYLESLSAPVEDEEKVCREILARVVIASPDTSAIPTALDIAEGRDEEVVYIREALSAMREYARRLRASHSVGVTELLKSIENFIENSPIGEDDQPYASDVMQSEFKEMVKAYRALK